MTLQGKNAMDSLLAESLKELAVKEPIEKITIKEITDKAGVIRPTFYNHFQDKYEVLEWIILQDLIIPVRPLIENGMMREAMVILFSNIEKEKPFYSRAVRMDGPISFMEIAQRCVRSVLTEVLAKRIPQSNKKHKWLTPEIMASYYAQSMSFAAIEWVKSGMSFSAEEMSDAYCYMLSHSLDDIAAELQ